MIRIDEIYNHTFWPWIKNNKPGARVFFCDPPGRTDPDSLFNYGCNDTVENDYVFFHDQEPIQLDSFRELFDEVFIRNIDIKYNLSVDVFGPNVVWPSENVRLQFDQHMEKTREFGSFFQSRKKILQSFINSNSNIFKPGGHIVVSERGEFADQLTKAYGWKKHYYFYHGWACQDWYRGYDKTFLIPRAKDREPTRTFISPNRIIAGKRDHRVLFLYNIFKNQLEHNWISAPRICAYEKVDISVIAQKYCNIYPDIKQVFDQSPLPIRFPGEDVPVMSSCWLTNFDEAADSLLYVPTETVYFGQRTHITEKTFKAIALEMPFVLVAPAGSLEYMREYGFKTFGQFIDESYDTETNDIRRVEKVVKLLKDLDNLTIAERRQLHQAMLPTVEHNYNHFFKGGLSDILWPELIGMLNGLCN